MRNQQPSPAYRFASVAALVLLFVVVYFRGVMVAPAVHFQTGDFAIAPYLQLGRTGHLEDVEIVWGTTEDKVKWTVETSWFGNAWAPSEAPTLNRVAVESVEPFWLCHARVRSLIPAGSEWGYRILRDGKVVYEGTANAFHSGLQPYKFAVMGDVAAGGMGESAVAHSLYDAKPDLVLIAGDIVYLHGRLSEYLRRMFPVYNADAPSEHGVPMMRSTVFVAAPGNHDTARGSVGDSSNLEWYPDGLAYYELWRQPLNGPDLPKQGTVNIPNVRGSEPQVDAFMRAAGDNFPRMGNFSFDYGNAHFVILDANIYMDWQDSGLRSWLEKDLQSAKLATWKFVMFHQPPFSVDLHHYNEQQMRLVADIFQRNHVDVVFSGHVHNYQRSRPLSFAIKAQPDGKLIADDFTVDGVITMDTKYDGVTNTKPDGVIYVITGCGGATLVGNAVPVTAPGAPKFGDKMVAAYSFTQCDVAGKRLTVQQVDPSGKVLDKFEINK